MGISPVNWLLSRVNDVTRRGVPLTVTPSHCAMGVLADQFSVAVPLRVSRPSSNASQSDIKSGLLATSETSPSAAQLLAVGPSMMSSPPIGTSSSSEFVRTPWKE